MNKILITIICFLITISCAESKNRSIEPEKSKGDKQTVKQSKDITNDFCEDFDISKNIKSKYLGAFGKNYYRIDLTFNSIIKDSICRYKVIGTTTLKNKKVSFSGNIIINKVEMANSNLYGFDDSTNYKTKVIASYYFKEDESVDGAGTFSGQFELLVHITKDNKIKWDMWDWMGDSYTNFIFDGDWISHKGVRYSAYFADGKLEIGDLNVGAGEFVPSKHYLKYGWWDYAELYYADDTVLVNKMKKLKEANKR